MPTVDQKQPFPAKPTQEHRRPRVTTSIFFGLGVLALGVLALTVVASYLLDVPIAALTRDPLAVAQGRPYFGFLSNVGAVFWSFSAAVCLFTFVILPRPVHQSNEFPRFILFGGLISLILLGDDLFMLHEIVYPRLFHVTQLSVYIGYMLLLLFYIYRFRSTIQNTAYPMLVLAGLFFTVSIGVDLLPDELLEQLYLLEDGAKFLGIVSWFGYQLSVCAMVVRSTLEERLE